MPLISDSASQYWCYTQKVMQACASSLQNLFDLQEILDSGVKLKISTWQAELLKYAQKYLC